MIIVESRAAIAALEFYNRKFSHRSSATNGKPSYFRSRQVFIIDIKRHKQFSRCAMLYLTGFIKRINEVKKNEMPKLLCAWAWRQRFHGKRIRLNGVRTPTLLAEVQHTKI